MGKILTQAFTNTSAFFMCTVYGRVLWVCTLCTHGGRRLMSGVFLNHTLPDFLRPELGAYGMN